MKLVLNRRTDYAIRALVFLAEQDGGRAKAAAIAEAMDVPKGFLHQVLQSLIRARIVSSQPSRRGGYALVRSPDEISILSVAEAMEGPLDPDECTLRGGPCHWDEVCALHWVWSAAREAVGNQLRIATIAQVAADDKALAQGTKAIPADSHRQREHAHTSK